MLCVKYKKCLFLTEEGEKSDPSDPSDPVKHYNALKGQYLKLSGGYLCAHCLYPLYSCKKTGVKLI